MTNNSTKDWREKNKDYCCKALTLEVELHIPVWQI